MPHTQPLPTRLHDGVVAVVLAELDVFPNPGAKHPLHPGLAQGDEITAMGEPAIGAGKRWWRVKKQGEAGIAWAVECDHDRYYLEPKNGVDVGEPVIYIVQPGDSWSKIAAKFQTSVQVLQKTNPGLVRPHDVIHPGDRMRIPG